MEVEMELPNVNNETFVAPSSNTTPAGPINPVTAAIKAAAAKSGPLSPQLDSTFNVAPPAKSKKNSIPPQDSIMTEDLSMAEEPQMVKQEPLDSPPRKPAATKATSVKPAPASKKNMEIFK